jgi:RHS repeat-associated protein
MVTSPTQVIVWRASNFAFHRSVSQDNIGGLNLGFPGQYYDSETGLWNNGFRDYDASVGRYVESDPIGLGGGINTYAYVGADPVNNTDSSGLITDCEMKALREMVNKYGYGPQVNADNFKEDPNMTGHSGQTGRDGISYIGTNPAAGWDQYSGSVVDRNKVGDLLRTGWHENVHQGELQQEPAYTRDWFSEKFTGYSHAEELAEKIEDANPGAVDEFKEKVKDCNCKK